MSRQKSYDTEDIIRMAFGDRPNGELSEIPKGWQDGFTKGIQIAQIEYWAYQVYGKAYAPPEKKELCEPAILEVVRLERNSEQDPEDKLLVKQIENITNLFNFKSWNF